jgi:nitronate monooxygenase
VALRFPELTYPIVGAPLAGGPSTPALTAAVSNAGGLGFLAAGYLSVDALKQQIDETRALTDAPFGVNIFVIGEAPVDHAAVDAYIAQIRPEAEARGVQLGEPRFEDDHFDDKVALAIEERIPVVSFTFGCPPAQAVDRLHEHDLAAWITVTEWEESMVAHAVGADALVVQGIEAGGHRGGFSDGVGRDASLMVTLRLIAGQELPGLPLVAAGGIMDGPAAAAAIVAGASAAQLGTALMLSQEAGTSPAQRRAFKGNEPTAITRAFTGRRARGINNAFMARYGAHAPSAYPQIHHVTSPLRKAGREQGDADVINLWAGQGYGLAQAKPAGEIVREIGANAQALLAGR